MTRGSRQKSKTTYPETLSAPSPSEITIPIPSLTDISQACKDTGSQSSALVASKPFELHNLESSASAGPKNMKTDPLDSQDGQGLTISLSSDAGKPSTQATHNQKFSAKSKRSKKKAKKSNAQEQGSQPLAAAVPPDILPLSYCGSMPAPPTISPKPNVGSPSVSSPLACPEPTKADETLRQENEELREKLDEANRLAKALKESNSGLEEEIEAWKQKCEGFSEVIQNLRNDVEGMIDSRLSKFFDKMEEGRENDKEEKEEKEEERKEKEGKEKRRKRKVEKEKVRKENKGKEVDRRKGDLEAEEAELKARQKSQKSCFHQLQDYRQRQKAEERRRKRWWNRFQIKSSRTSRKRVLITLFLLGLFILVLAPIVLIGITEILAYNRAHAQRIARLKLKETRKVQLAKAVAQFVADLSPEPIRGTLYHWFLNDGWNLDDPSW